MEVLTERTRTVQRRQRARHIPTIFIFGVRVDNIDCETALTMIDAFISHRDNSMPRKVFFTNVHTLYTARRDRDFRHKFNAADIILADGSGLALAGRVMGTPIEENLNGTDFTPKVLHLAETKGWTVYLLGARNEIVARSCSTLLKQYPRLNIVGFHHGYFSKAEEQSVIDNINASKPDILLVAFGTPFQEMWISQNARHLKVGVCLAIGGFFDFLSGSRSRAPLWMRRLGIEWVYRIMWDPRTKWRRAFVEIPYFLCLVAAKRLIPRTIKSLMKRKVM